MRVLVTGGAGFIGSRLVQQLARAGDDVVVLDSLRPDAHGSTEGPGPVLPDGVRFLRGDLRDRAAVEDALAGADAVAHLGAKVGLGVDLDDIDDYVASNDLGTAVLLRATAAAGAGRVVYASSMVVYGEGAYDCPEHGRVAPGPRRRTDLDAGQFEPPCPRCGRALAPGTTTEDAPADPRNVYAATKLHGEHLLSAWAAHTGGSAAAMRFHNVYGPGMPKDTPYAGVAALFRSRIERGEAPRVFEDGRQRRDFVHVDDVARAVATALRAPVRGGPDPAAQSGPGLLAGAVRAYNVGSGTVTTVGEMAAELSRAVAGVRGDGTGADPGALAPVVTGEYRLGDVRHVTASSARAADELGWRARVSLADGVREFASAPLRG